MAFASLLIILLAISSSSAALTEPLASTANPTSSSSAALTEPLASTANPGVFPEYRGRGRGEEEREENPYVFHSDSFRTRASSEAGEIRALPNFGEVSELLEGIRKFRVTCIEMKPNTVMLPHYIDATWILYVTRGRGYIAYVHQNELVKRKLEEGDVFGVPSGHTFYLVNNDDHNTLRIASLLRPVSTIPGEYQPFYVAGGRNPQTVYSAFSDDVLEAAFNTNVQRLERIFGGHKRGVIIRASEEEIREMMRRGFSAGSMSASEHPKPFNLRNQKPDFENENGRFTTAGPKNYPFLDALDVSVGLADLNPGSMTAPSLNTKSTSIGIVTNGEGMIEMACPHLGQHGWSSPRERGDEEITYQRVRAKLRTGSVYVVPAGHPITEIASTNSRLQILWFDFNTRGNERQFLAGKNNVLNTLEREIRQISFNVPRGEEIEEVLQAQRDQVILRGPQRQSREEPRSSS